MGHDKLRKFAENETFSCLIQPSSAEILANGYFDLQDHEIKGHWNERMFAKEQPVILELGCGKGEYTIDLAKRNPQYNYIGVDIKGARLWKGAKQATVEKLPNVAFLRTRIEFITAFFAPGEISQIWLTFSDPQMKSENSRLTSPLFMERYRKMLVPGGIIHLKTDSRFLHEYSLAMASQNGLRIYSATNDLYSTSKEDLFVSRESPLLDDSSVDALYEVRTFYEKMFMAQGYKITYLCFGIDREGEYIYPEFDAKYWRSVEGPRLLNFTVPNET